MSNYTVAVPDSQDNKNRYNDLIKRWWNWLYTPDRDNVSYPDICFLRGGVIGSPLLVTAGMFSNAPDEVSCYMKNVSINGKTFFSVFIILILWNRILSETGNYAATLADVLMRQETTMQIYIRHGLKLVPTSAEYGI